MKSFLRLSLFIVILFEFLLWIEAKQWRDVWRDDFDGPAGSIPTLNWIFDEGTSYPGGPNTWGTGEVQSYTSSSTNVRRDGKGNLLIIPLRSRAGKWTSARIESKRSDFKPHPGGKLAIEARIQMPNVNGNKAVGYWPAFWALGAPFRGNYNNWPSIGEFDIMENVNGLNFVKGVLHCGVENGGPCNEREGKGHEVPCPGTSCQSGFHTYRFEWDDSPNLKEFRWYVDNNFYYKINRDEIGAHIWDQITRHGYFVILNVAIGGGYPNYKFGRTTPLPETEPGHPMVVDYVKVETYV